MGVELLRFFRGDGEPSLSDKVVFVLSTCEIYVLRLGGGRRRSSNENVLAVGEQVAPIGG